MSGSACRRLQINPALIATALLIITHPVKAETSTDALLARLEKLEHRTQVLELENKQMREQLGKRSLVSAEKTSVPSNINRKPTTLASKSFRNQESSNSIVATTTDQNTTKTTGWHGVYAGINAGYGINNINDYSYLLAPNNVGYTSGFSQYAGPIVGAQVGYNYEFASKIILGLEADMNWADVNNSVHTAPFVGKKFQSLAYLSQGGTSLDLTEARSGLDWLGTVRVRLGYDLGRFMPFVSGGFAYGGLSANGFNISGSNISSSLYGSYSLASGGLAGGSYSTVSTGWGLGAGFEYLVADNWSLKGEYLYTQLQGLSGNGLSIASVSQNNNGTITKLNGASYVGSNQGAFGVNQARIGLNYHLNWLALRK